VRRIEQQQQQLRSVGDGHEQRHDHERLNGTRESVQPVHHHDDELV